MFFRFVGLVRWDENPCFSPFLFPGVQSEDELEVPPEDLCRPYIEKALKDLGTGNVEMLRDIRLGHSDF